MINQKLREFLYFVNLYWKLQYLWLPLHQNQQTLIIIFYLFIRHFSAPYIKQKHISTLLYLTGKQPTSSYFPVFYLLFLSLFQNVLEQKAKERKWRRTLASLQRLRSNKDDEENDARGDLSSAIVTSVALEEPTSVGASKSVPRVCSQFLASIVLGFVCNNNDRNRDRCLNVDYWCWRARFLNIF